MNRPQPERPLRRGRVKRYTLRDDPAQQYYLYVPTRVRERAPLLVSVHGLTRKAFQHARRWAPYAERYGVVVVAPRFDEDRFGDYQRLGRDEGGRADAVLDEIVRDANRLAGMAEEPIALFGFSGGAQFAHRYAMAYPGKVARAVLVSAGWYTFPDPAVRYPYGVRANRRYARIRFDPKGFLRVPMTVLATQEEGTDGSLRRTARCDQQQGVTRWERARRWVGAMRAAAEVHRVEPTVHVEEFPGGDHSFRNFMRDERLACRAMELLLGRHEPARDHRPRVPGPARCREHERWARRSTRLG